MNRLIQCEYELINIIYYLILYLIHLLLPFQREGGGRTMRVHLMGTAQPSLLRFPFPPKNLRTPIINPCPSIRLDRPDQTSCGSLSPCWDFSCHGFKSHATGSIPHRQISIPRPRIAFMPGRKTRCRDVERSRVTCLKATLEQLLN